MTMLIDAVFHLAESPQKLLLFTAPFLLGSGLMVVIIRGVLKRWRYRSEQDKNRREAIYRAALRNAQRDAPLE